MNDVTQQKLTELVSWLVDTAKSTETFVLDQAPDVARQIVAWGFWSAATYLILWFTVAAGILLAVACLLPWYTRALRGHAEAVAKSDREFMDAEKAKYEKKFPGMNPSVFISDYEMRNNRPLQPECVGVFGGMRWVAMGVAALIAVIAVSVNLPVMVKCTVAPKVYLIEQAAKLLK